jgi:hypothetical protein
MASQMESGIDEYLRKRLMPVGRDLTSGQNRHVREFHSRPGSVGGDLFEYINFHQRYQAQLKTDFRLQGEDFRHLK